MPISINIRKGISAEGVRKIIAKYELKAKSVIIIRNITGSERIGIDIVVILIIPLEIAKSKSKSLLF